MKQKKGNTVYYTYDPKNPPKISKAYLKRLDAMTDEEITAAALSDPDNPPITDEEWKHFYRVQAVKPLRQELKLTQAAFAKAFGLPLSTVKDWEQMRYMPDQAARNFLRVIAYAPDVVRKALGTAP